METTLSNMGDKYNLVNSNNRGKANVLMGKVEIVFKMCLDVSVIIEQLVNLLLQNVWQ